MKRTQLARKTPLRARSPMRRSRPKSTPVRRAADGKECPVNIPGYCNGWIETTVLAHLRYGNVAGGGQKPPDTCATFACNGCHGVIDGRIKTDLDPEFIELLALRGMHKTHAMLHADGFRLVKTEG